MRVIPTMNLPPATSTIKNKCHQIKQAFAEEENVEKRSSTGRLFKLFSTFCDQTSLHGLGEVVGNKSYFVKSLWTAAFIIAIAGNAYHLSNLIGNYLLYPKQQVTSTSATPIPFPGVTICNLDAFSKSNFARVSSSPDSKLHKFESRISHLITSGLMTEYDALSYYTPLLLLENIGLEESRQVGHSLEDFVLRCTFRGRPCDIRRDFKHIINSLLYNCYTFSPGNITDNFNSVGQEYGLSLILYLEVTNGTKTKSQYFPHINVANSIGARVVIHPQGASPLPQHRGVDVMPGHSTSISYKPQHIFRLGEPYGSCTVDGDKILHDGARYEPLLCMGECMQRFILGECKCKISFEPAVSDPGYLEYPYCFLMIDAGNETEMLSDSFQKKMCLGNNWLLFDRNLTRRSNCGCHPRCEDHNYPHSVSESKWPAAQYFDSFLQTELNIRKDKHDLKAYNQLKKVNILFIILLNLLIKIT